MSGKRDLVVWRAELQNSFAPRLPHWRKYRRKALYRRTEDFVQWLVFDPVGFMPAVRLWTSIQALAAQLPTIDLTLGGIISSRDRFDVWLTPQLWESEKADVISYVVSQIKPNALEPLTIPSIEKFLQDQFVSSDHFSLWLASGVAAMVQQKYERGYRLLRQARQGLSQVNQPWAVADVARLDSWLGCPPQSLLGALRADARGNSEALGIG